jgi:hypothetical protein
MSALNCCPVCFSDEHLSAEWCPNVWIDKETGTRVFTPPVFASFSERTLVDTGEAYDFTQTTEGVRDGDLIRCQHEGREVWAVLVSAWPVAFDGLDEEGQAGELHTLDHILDLYSLDEGKYAKSFDVAERYVEAQAAKS